MIDDDDDDKEEDEERKDDVETKDDDEKEDEDEEKDDDEEKEGKTEKEEKDKTDEESPWGKFFEEFTKQFKMGCYEDDSNRSKLSKPLRFASTKFEEGRDISLDKHLDRMQKSQENIYCMSG